MKWLRSAFAAIVLIMGAGAAHAQYTVPESGWYWNPVLSGSGINMEFQDNAMYLSYYAYRDNGESAFFTVQSAYDPVTRRVQGTLYTFVGGQCIGCPYVRPTPVAVGTATIQFTSLGTAQITFATSAGTAQFTVQRFVFTLSYYPTVSDQKKGLWAFTVIRPSNLPWGDLLAFSTVQTNANGVPLALGAYHPSNSAVAGSPVTGSSIMNYLVLIDFSASSYALYYGEWTLGHFLGFYEIYPKSGSPTFSGTLAVGSKIAGPATLSAILNGATSGPVLEDKAAREHEFAGAAKQAARLSSEERQRLVRETDALEAELEWRAMLRGQTK